MMIDWAPLNDDVLDAFGETVIVTVGVASTEITAVFEESWTGMAVGGMQVERPDPTISALTSVWSATAAKEGAQVTVRGEPMRVIGVTGDDAGMTTVNLGRFR